jgi:excinuclease ABC subunit A
VLNDIELSESNLLIAIHGAREHNLQNLSLQIPRDQFVVITGVSGSGKSTLAFDLLFAEGQRRFLDSMNTYARQFVEQMARPDVDRITGLPPTVSIEQRSSRGGGKSTVATVTEIHQFLRLLFSRLGTLYCPDCQLPVQPQTRDELTRQLQAAANQRGTLRLLAPRVRNRKGFHTDVAEWAAQHGYEQIRADGQIVSSGKRLRLDRFREHDVEIVVGTLLPGRQRSPSPKISELIETTLRLGQGTLYALDRHDQLSVHSTSRACVQCSRSFPPLDPKHFSYNSAQGWCPRCRGFGELFHLPDVDRGARADAIEESWFEWQEGKRELCPDCRGARLHPVARSVRFEAGDAAQPAVRGRLPNDTGIATTTAGAPTIDTLGQSSVDQAHDFFQTLKLDGRDRLIARDILPELIERLTFLRTVGLGYLQLSRSVPTLSGGEAQRIHLAAQLGSNLTGVLYILDEPTIGLHPRDNEQLLATLTRLRARGNSLVVVEHDEATMRHADHIIDLGPGAGAHGGRMVASGTLAELVGHPDSITGQCLRQHRTFPSRGHRRPVQATDHELVLSGARMHNLKNISVSIPLQRLVLVTGVSGSGKSTLLRHCLSAAWRDRRPPQGRRPSPNDSPPHGRIMAGADRVRTVHEVDQSPIGRTPRSIPATYVGFFDEIRRLFAQLPEARLRGYSAGRFSFNSPKGRCPDCDGVGSVKLEMNFLPPAFVTCATCAGRRFSPDTLDIEFHGHNIAQVLALTVDQALELFASISRVARPLQALRDTGLGYLKLGQTSPTLSGGEAQRVKLVSHLLTGLTERAHHSDREVAGNLFLLEEPTVGLHMADVKLLLAVLHRLVDAGHTVVVIEHNLDLIADADWILDLGPEGGDGGGQIVVTGTPESVAQCKRSHTGRFLADLLRPESVAVKSRRLRPRP